MKFGKIKAYRPSDAVIRAEWTGETVEQAQSVIDAERASLAKPVAATGAKRFGKQSKSVRD